MNVIEFIRDLADTVETDDWEPTDSGFQLAGGSYLAKLQKGPTGIRLAVESYDGRLIAEGSQKVGRDGIDDELSNKLATLYVAIGGKEIKGSAELDDVLRDLRSSRKQVSRRTSQ